MKGVALNSMGAFLSRTVTLGGFCFCVGIPEKKETIRQGQVSTILFQEQSKSTVVFLETFLLYRQGT